MSARVLIVDDDDSYRRTLARAVRRRGHDVETAANGHTARSAAEQAVYDVIVLDYELPETTGLALLPELRPLGHGAAFILATGLPDLDLAVRAMNAGAFDYVSKNGALEECLLRIDRAAEVTALRRRMAEASGAREHKPGHTPSVSLIGEGAAMRELQQRLDALTRADDTTALLTGETGTGKGVVARWIHAHSGRAYEPFVAVDCTTIPATLVESELFGHEKGSFSGATGTKIGRVEAAGRGTLFLDEIGELELPIQAKLLRLLEEREYSRIGSTRMRHLGARIVAATNRDLEKAVSEGRFRADLRYRLDVFRVHLAPLRERGEDVILLASHFLEQMARAQGRPKPELAKEVRDALTAYPFPGNVRELRNLIEQALLLEEGSTLGLQAFPVLRQQHPAPRRESRRRPQRSKTLAAIRAEAEAAEKDQIVAALEETAGNVSAAARTLGMSRYRLLRRLEKFGLR